MTERNFASAQKLDETTASLDVAKRSAEQAKSASDEANSDYSPKKQARLPITGMVRETKIRIALDATGRLTSVAVHPGDQVRKGDLMAFIDNPEQTARLGEARAAAASARAEREYVGDHDLTAFLLRLDPQRGIEGFEPGMSVWLAERS